MEVKAEQELDIRIKGLWDAFLLLRDNAECFLSFASLRDRQSDEETCLDTGGDRWRDEDSVLFFIYTPVITVSLASGQIRRIDLSCSLSLSSPPLLPISMPYFSYFEKLCYAGGKWTCVVTNRRTRIISLCFVYAHIFLHLWFREWWASEN